MLLHLTWCTHKTFQSLGGCSRFEFYELFQFYHPVNLKVEVHNDATVSPICSIWFISQSDCKTSMHKRQHQNHEE